MYNLSPKTENLTYLFVEDTGVRMRGAPLRCISFRTVPYIDAATGQRLPESC